MTDQPNGIKVRRAKISDLVQDDKNANKGTSLGQEMLTDSLKDYGAGRSLLADKDGKLIAGNKTALRAADIGIEDVIIVETDGSQLVVVQRTDVDLNSQQGRAMAIADNRVAEVDLEWDAERLKQLIDEGIPVSDFFPQDELDQILAAVAANEGESTGFSEEDRATLLERFLIAPFSVFDARTGAWRDRKKKWLDLGLRSEIGRGADDDKTARGLTFSNSAQPLEVYKRKNDYDAKLGRKSTWAEFYAANPDAPVQNNTSIFDPVLTEIAYRWFCPLDGTVLDPFAGGSVRGIIAELLGRKYTGIDLQKRQIEANYEQAKKFKLAPNWIVGDSSDIPTLLPAEAMFDFILSCPPYFDLEVYSDDPDDLSNVKSYAQFLALYRDIIAKSVARLKENRFAFWVVGDLRDSRGMYTNFVSDSIQAFLDAGMSLYNEAILITQGGSLAIRVGGQFSKSRKLGKTHQNVLVFVKGDPKLATEACGEVEVEMPEEDIEEEEA